jgi:hypothetical protein
VLSRGSVQPDAIFDNFRLRFGGTLDTLYTPRKKEKLTRRPNR